MKKPFFIIWIVTAGILIVGLLYSAKHTATPETPPINEEVHVFYPLPNGVVNSPLEVRGEARGSWFFEAVFPVRLLDANGQVIQQVQAHAQGDWQTESFVQFTADFSFSPPKTDTGTLVFNNDNPSGLPENDKELRMPVRFK